MSNADPCPGCGAEYRPYSLDGPYDCGTVIIAGQVIWGKECLRRQLEQVQEQLRRERETLAGDVRLISTWIDNVLPREYLIKVIDHSYEQELELVSGALRRLRDALLDGQQDAHTTTYRQMDECSDGWECTAPDCDTAWTLPDGGPSHHRMRYCPGCGRRIVGEEPWRDGDGT